MRSTDVAAPTYAQLRPLKPTTTEAFPVYRDLVDHLAEEHVHPDPTVAHVLGTCAGYAYSGGDTVAMIAARMGLENNRCHMIAETVDAMFIRSTAFLIQSEDGRVVILAYRGTEPGNFINWLTAVDVHPERVELPLPCPADSFEVHGGFYRNVRATRYAIVTALLRAIDGHSVLGTAEPVPHPLEALYLTGHSLGGAMAGLLGIMLATEEAYRPIRARLRAVYTYGQPMIGSPDLARACDADDFIKEHVIRYVYRRDVVPHLPPRDSGAFGHFGREYRYESEWPWRPHTRATEQMRALGGLVEAPLTLVARQLRVLRNIPFQYSLDDHGPQHYVAALTPPGVATEFGDV